MIVPTAIAISYGANGLFWEAVSRFLQSMSNVTLCQVAGQEDIVHFLGRPDSTILIIEQGAAINEGALDYCKYFQLNPQLAIVAIDPTGFETLIRLNNVGQNLLAKLLRAVIEEQPIDQDLSGQSKITLLRANDVTSPAIDNALFSLSRVPADQLNDAWACLQRWLDIRFQLCLLHAVSASGEANVPSWAMSPSLARATIGGEHCQSTEAQLRQALSVVESQLFTDALRSSPLLQLKQVFALSKMAWQLFLLVLAPELDGRYARVLGYLNDDLTRQRPTPSLLARLLELPDSVWELRHLISGESRINEYQLIVEDPVDNHPGSDVGLCIAPDLVRYLLTGVNAAYLADGHLQFTSAYSLDAARDLADQHWQRLHTKLDAWRSAEKEIHLRDGNQGEIQRPLWQLLGDQDAADWFCDSCLLAGEHVLLLDVSAQSQGDHYFFNETLPKALRAAQLLDAILLLKGFHRLLAGDYPRWSQQTVARAYPGSARVVCHFLEPETAPHTKSCWYIQGALRSHALTKALWQACAGQLSLEVAESELNILSGSQHLTGEHIHTILTSLADQFSTQALTTLDVLNILKVAKGFRSSAIPTGVCRIEPSYRWQDIILPAAVISALKIIPHHIHESAKVLDDWGYRKRMPYGHGVTALFCGPSGTGKTMAAQIIAAELSMELFQVDLSKTISKYIGETEKNLDAVFDAAESAGAVLLFDEADALFGKRTEVRDAHDRYANVEVAYLLQRMERFGGLAILTTNLRQNLDKAFMRRLRFVIDFPMPESREREAIWRASFPPSAPLAEDVNFKFLARRLALAGGNIQQIAIRAAFSAAAENKPQATAGIKNGKPPGIQMRHIVQATHSELSKLGMGNAQHSLAEFMPEARCVSHE